MEKGEDTEANIERRKQFEKYIEQKDRAREENQAQRKQKQLDAENPQQKMLAIQKIWREKLAGILVCHSDTQTALTNYKSKTLQYQFLMATYHDLKNFYLKTNYAMNTFDRQNYKETLEKLLNNMTEAKKKQQPRKKFKFSRRDQDFGVAFKAKEKEVQVNRGQSHEKTIPGLENVRDSQHIYSTEQLNKPFKVIRCENVNVELKGMTDIIFLKELKNCIVKAGPTKSTVFVDHCYNCTFELACHQLRIHNSKDTNFSIFTSSKAIIQDTTSVQFKPYKFQYQGWEEHMKACDLSGKPNLWREIQDFNWLKQEASPNFTLIDKDNFD